MERRTTLPIKKVIVGIDEAGRGSLVGDMFIAGACISEEKISLLQKLGVRDSKLLTPHRREELFEIIKDIVEYYTVRRVSPSEIDEQNLNDLLYKNIVDILLELIEKCERINKVYIDLTGNKYKLLKFINNRIGYVKWEIVAEHKADQKYIPVSVASIIAKVLRDKHIHELSKTYGDIGSGYPADPKTIKWLREYLKKHGELPPIVRRTWRTLKDIAPEYYVNKTRGKVVTLDRFLKLERSKD